MTESELLLKQEIVELKQAMIKLEARLEEIESGSKGSGIYLDGVQLDYKYTIMKELQKEVK